MTNVNTDGLPPEMQARIASIIDQAKAGVAQPATPVVQPAQGAVQPPAPVAKAPSLMDHVIALRQEVHALRQETAAAHQVVEACGNAVGQLYGLFHQQTQPTDYGQSYQEQVDSDY